MLASKDLTTALDIDGTRQQVRLCHASDGGPPVLVVQAGPGFPLLNEVARFQRLLQLEREFSVAYWDQRGCGRAALRDARRVSLESQVRDVHAVARWLAGATGERVILLGISLGATASLLAAARDATSISAVVAVSVDVDIPASDASVYAGLRDAAARDEKGKAARLVEKIGPPPYTRPGPFQRRMRLLTDLGGVERGKTFAALLRGTLWSLFRTYGPIGAVKALRNMNAVQHRMLPEVSSLNLLDAWPRPPVPVHYVFGERDPLVPRFQVQKVSAMAAPGDSVVTALGAGHMAHFDAPELVRAALARARSAHARMRA